MKQRRRVKESEKRVRDTGSIYRPLWPPYWKLLFLEEALALTTSDDPSERRDSEDLSLATMVQNPRRNSDVSFDRTNSETDLSLVTMVDNPRHSESCTAEDDSLTALPEVHTDALSGGLSSSPFSGNTHSHKPKASGRLSSSLHVGNAHSPIRIDDDIQEGVEVEKFQEESDEPTDRTPLESDRSHFLRPHSPTYPIFPPTDLSPPQSVTTFPLNIPNSLALALPSGDISPPGKRPKRGFPNSNDNDAGIVFHDTIDSLRTVAERIREDTSDDVGGFLKMIGFQLRSIDDPLRRMRVMHAIQGVILDEIVSTVR